MSVDKKSEPSTDERFLSRWARVKHSAQAQDTPTAEQPTDIEPVEGARNTSIDGPDKPKVAGDIRATGVLPDSPVADALPSLDSLTPQSDFSPFMARDVDPQLRNLAMKKLFTDPHYNVMDRLDIYIDDYSVHQPLSLDIIRQMSISKTLGLFDDEEETGASEKVSTGQPPETAMPRMDQIATAPPSARVDALTRDEAVPANGDAEKALRSEQRREST